MGKRRRSCRAAALGAVVLWSGRPANARQELPDPVSPWFAVSVASLPTAAAVSPPPEEWALDRELEAEEAALESDEAPAAPPTSASALARMDREASDAQPEAALGKAYDGGGGSAGESPLLLAGIGLLDAPASPRPAALPPGAAVRPLPLHVAILASAASRGRDLRLRLARAGAWTGDAVRVRAFESDLRLTRAILQDYAAALRGVNGGALQGMLALAAMRAAGFRPGAFLPAPDPSALVEMAQFHAALADLNVLRAGLGAMTPVERARAAERLERLLRSLDSGAARSAPLAQARAQLFLAGQQLPGGAFPTGWGGAWDNTQMRVPVTAMVLEALHGIDLHQEGRPQAQGLGYIAENMGLTREELVRNGESFTGNNVEPYALAYSLWAVLEQYEAAAPGSASALALAAQARALIARISATSWRYSTSGTSAATFQLAFLARSLRRARQAGFAVPIRADSAPALAMAALPLAGPQGSLGAGLVGAAATVDGGALGTILERLASSRDATSGGFPYYVGRPAGREDSAFRSPLIEVILYQGGRSDRARLRAAVQRFLDHRAEFERVILGTGFPGPDQHWHDPAHHSWAPYYYPYAMHGSALALEELAAGGPADRRFARRVARELLRTLLSQQAPDGSWRPSPHFGSVADTATFATTVASLRRTAGR